MVKTKLDQFEIDENGCWKWQRMRTDRGYGRVKVRGKQCRAHKVIWEMTYGEVPFGKELHHECGNRLCINPAHLRLVDKATHLGLSYNNITTQNKAKTHFRNQTVSRMLNQ